METKFYKCDRCGQIIAVVKGTGAPLVCCGEKMKELVPGSVDASQEKHVPVIIGETGAVTVKIGSAAHPMTPEHYIEWIVLRTTLGNQRKALTPEDAPEARFALLDGEEIISALAYCNLHGLWEGFPEK
jgi:superoxide reductase